MIGYLGPSGTFSHMAAAGYAPNAPLKEFPTIYAVIMAVQAGLIVKGIVPIENSIEGSVNVTLDTLFFDVDLYITDEYILKIEENLIVKPGARREQIKKIISHPQPIGQCSKLLNHDFADVEIGYTNSTADAAKAVAASDGSIAMLGPKKCAELYDLELLIPNCGDELHNSTRFAVIERTQNLHVTASDKTSIAFTLNNTPGSLYQALELFKTYAINMIKIESRPVKKELGTYVFFIDINGNIDNATIYFALDKLRGATLSFKFLGSYKKAQESRPDAIS